MLQKKYPGFSLVEVMIWITIIGVIFGIIVRGAFKKPPLNHFPYFIKELNNASFFAQQESISTSQILKLIFTQKIDGGCQLELFHQENQNNGLKKKDNWIPHKSLLSPANLILESNIVVNKKQIETNDLNKNDVNEISTYFFPSGFCEKLNLELVRNDQNGSISVQISLNPFLCKFEQKDLSE